MCIYIYIFIDVYRERVRVHHSAHAAAVSAQCLAPWPAIKKQRESM